MRGCAGCLLVVALIACNPAQFPEFDPNAETLTAPTTPATLSSNRGATSPDGPATPGLYDPVLPTIVAENIPEPVDSTANTDKPTLSTEMVRLSLGDRDARLFLPSNYNSRTDWPVVVLLHGYSAGGVLQDLYLGLSRRVDELQVVALIPEGTRNGLGLPFWNATEFCCDTFGSGVDDVGFINKLVDHVVETYRVDAKRVYVMGHSNGGFMAFRLACEAPERYAAMLSLAGATFKDEKRCKATLPTTIVAVHGTLDPIVLYGGTPLYPGAEETVSRFRSRNGCEKSPATSLRKELV
ncbi:MAG: prolyl oligopeptidase family serine peptidase, partial [Planctomycetales bacterium]|nr:prolyl oligopeptidase family serine peptidase [Planctomycetales bacterium]